MKLISFLVPAHNESTTLKTLITELLNSLTKIDHHISREEIEIVFLDDGSSDDTGLVISKIDYKGYEVRFLRNVRPSGIARAFSQLYSEAQGEWMFLIPGDFQWRQDAIDAALNEFIKYEKKFAISTIRESKPGYSKSRKIVSSTFSQLARLLIRNKTKLDPGSVKIVPRDIMKLVRYSKTPAMEIERLYLSQQITQRRLVTIPVKSYERMDGRSASGNPLLIIRSLFETLKILFYYLISSRFLRK